MAQRNDLIEMTLPSPFTRALTALSLAAALGAGCDDATSPGFAQNDEMSVEDEDAGPEDDAPDEDEPTDDAGPFDDAADVVLSGLLNRGYSCYADDSGAAASFVADIAFAEDGRLLVRDAEGELTQGSFSEDGESLTLSVPSLGFEETSLDGTIGFGQLVDFVTPSLQCHLVALDVNADSSQTGYRCPEIDHDVSIGYYAWNRFYVSDQTHGSVYREELQEFTQVPDTTISRRDGVYAMVDGVAYMAFGAQAGDEAVFFTAREVPEGIVIDQLSPDAGPCTPL